LFRSLGVQIFQRPVRVHIDCFFDHLFQFFPVGMGEDKVHLIQCIDDDIIIVDEESLNEKLKLFDIGVADFANHAKVNNSDPAVRSEEYISCMGIGMKFSGGKKLFQIEVKNNF